MPILPKDFTEERFATFNPEVQAAIKANEQGQNNVVVNKQLTKRDPRFRFTTPTPTPISPSTVVADDETAIGTPLDQEIAGLDRTAPTAVEQQTIRQQARQDMQAFIDSVNTQFNVLRQEETASGLERTG